MSKSTEFYSSPNSVQQTSEDRQPDALHERIQKRAYELYQARGAAAGHALEDWVAAEAEVLRGRGIHRAA